MLLGLAAAVVALPGGAGAASLVPELRVATAFNSRFDADLVSAAWYTGVPRWTRAQRFEFAAGVIHGSATTRAFAFAGPDWQLTPARLDAFVEFSFGPTLLSGSTIDGHELGGNLHFRSALAVGRSFGRHRMTRIALRIEHISNGGLRDPNPGLDSIGLSFVSGIGRGQRPAR